MVRLLKKLSQIYPNPCQGDISLPLVSMVAALGVLGTGYLLNRTSLENKNAKLNERRDQAALTPLNAAVVAKALVSIPNASKWTTADFVADSNFLPSIYPDPYISSADVMAGRSNQDAISVLKLPTAGAIWNQDQFSSSRLITLNTTDANRISSKDLATMFAAAASGTGGSNPQSSSASSGSSIRYSLKNCGIDGRPSSVWTGYYCVEAEIASNTFANSSSTSNISHAKLKLGVVPPPPPPSCIYDSSPISITRGQSVAMAVGAVGVVTGYSWQMKNAAGQTLASDDKTNVFTAANRIATQNALETFTFESANFSDALIPDGSQVTFDLSLKGITGMTTCAQKTITVNNPVSCELKFFDYNSYSTPTLGSEISRAHENSFMYAQITSRGVINGDGLRVQFAGMTHADPTYRADANGLIIPANNQPHRIRVTAQGDRNLQFSAVGRIWRGGQMIKECSKTAELKGTWIATDGTRNCHAVCSSNGSLVSTFDKGGMSCLSGENFFSPAFASKRNGSNNPSFGSLQALINSLGFNTWGGSTGNFEQLRVSYPNLNKKTLNEGVRCYWANGNIMSYSGCGNDVSPLGAAACQKMDDDNTDNVTACYCGR